jgi:hypothetical protein
MIPSIPRVVLQLSKSAPQVLPQVHRSSPWLASSRKAREPDSSGKASKMPKVDGPSRRANHAMVAGSSLTIAKPPRTKLATSSFSGFASSRTRRRSISLEIAKLTAYLFTSKPRLGGSPSRCQLAGINLVHVTPHPVLTWFDRPNQRVCDLAKMSPRVLILRLIAASHMAAA